MNLNGKSILVTGGTGWFGQKFIRYILDRWPQIQQIVVFSRDETKQVVMSKAFAGTDNGLIKYVIGDVRDKERIQRACHGINYVIHAAALKHVPVSEYNPMEFIKTNTLGAHNVIEAALNNQVEKVVALSTDKAAAPVSLYGASKLAADKLVAAANNAGSGFNTVFSVVRYGNIFGSRGSVLPFFLTKRNDPILPITHPNMVRFTLSMERGIESVLFALENALGGEIFVPKIPSFKIVDLAKAINPDCKIDIIGVRPGEKLSEEMVTITDALNSIEVDDYYIICPPNNLAYDKADFVKHHGGVEVPEDFSYNSADNDRWVGVDELKAAIKRYIDVNQIDD